MNWFKKWFPPTHGVGWVLTAIYWVLLFQRRPFWVWWPVCVATLIHTYWTAWRDGHWASTPSQSEAHTESVEGGN